MTRRTPQTRKRNRRKSPSPPALSPEPSNANTQPPSDDVMIDNQTSITQADHPDTSQHSTTGHRELTDQEELHRAQTKAKNAVSQAYSTYHKPELLDHLDKKGQRMIAYPCKMCGGKINRPTSDSSCSNLLRHQATCLNKQHESLSSSNLAAFGVIGTGDVQWIWCYAHILNLIAQAILRPFGTVKKDVEDQIGRYEDDITDSGDDMGIMDKNQNLQSDNLEPKLTLDDIQDLSDEDEDSDLYTTVMCQQTLAKFGAIARKLHKSPNSKLEFVELCKEMGCDKPHSIVQDVCTRWNSTLDQLVSIVRCNKAIMAWQKDKKHGLDRRYHIHPIDIKLANDLISILQVFYEQTLQVSIPGSARLTHIIVSINEITDLLSNAIKGDGNQYPLALQNACRVGLQLTNKYYTLTDCSPLFRIVMVLHPSFKDEYFKIAGWEDDWIVEALRLTRDMFNTYYKPSTTASTGANPRKGSTKVRLLVILHVRPTKHPS
ncbi:hypothetical protein Pst134EB_003992 [Puccinia striiformis f. sp. tritici]|nr:hypothetical protein Pst134EB_003992 [Puccinia striiformis f. sp. tritici]